jgi:uncharacterized protein (TIGR03435 family)
MHRKCLHTLLIALFILFGRMGGVSALSSQEAAAIAVGDPAPALGTAKILHAPPEAQREGKIWKGKWVVIEFWATWCAPCVSAIPHWNDRVDKFMGRPVEFISITDEEPDRIEAFLAKRPIKGQVAIDASGATFKSYQVPGRPHTVIVDPNGKIAAMTTPDKLTDEVIDSLLAGRPITIPDRVMRSANLDWDAEEIDWKDGITPTFQILIKPIVTATGGHYHPVDSRRFTADGATLSNLVCAAWQTDFFHVDFRFPLSEQQYRVSVVVPPGQERMLFPIFQQALLVNFGIQAHWESQERQAFVLKPRAGASSPPLSKSDKEEYGFGHGRIVGRRQPLAKLVESLTNFLRGPVADETGLGGRYDWDLSYDIGDKDILMKEVRDKLGLELTPATRPVRVLVIETASAAK